MRTLYHFRLCPFSRKVRILLKEKGLLFELVEEKFWERRKEFSMLNSAMQVPVLRALNNMTIADSYAICEYIEDKHPERPMIGASPEERAEVRRIMSWFDVKFFQEVTNYLLQEKVIKFYTKSGNPDSSVIRAAKNNLYYHLDYIGYLTKEHMWLTGDAFTLADISAAAQISVMDYLGEVPWQRYAKVKDWYALVKSRPSFRPLLADNITGFVPPIYYSDPDF